MPAVVNSIVYSFVLQVKNLLGSRLSKAILYGSYARGDFRENSDVDIMILVRNMSDKEISYAEEQICDIAFDIELTENIHISAILNKEEQFKDWDDVLPFYMNVKREGIEIDAK